MRPIDAYALVNNLSKKPSLNLFIHTKNIEAAIDETPTIDAEPVRHEGNTTFITTTNLEGYTNRIIVGQGTQCKVYYADEDVRHGRWIPNIKTNYKAYPPYEYQSGYKCTLCGREERTNREPYCHCGAKMDVVKE